MGVLRNDVRGGGDVVGDSFEVGFAPGEDADRRAASSGLAGQCLADNARARLAVRGGMGVVPAFRGRVPADAGSFGLVFLVEGHVEVDPRGSLDHHRACHGDPARS